MVLGATTDARIPTVLLKRSSALIIVAMSLRLLIRECTVTIHLGRAIPKG
ncbi:unnamed protein product [Linum tenue]|uniref:Uncharacterized protein n=1 Tax=Linum tenue TaxID=586396 RepID=A0AAV0IA63_9ROSI|nr:unnamed protein product [Linum tenue]